mmetsp:Transcript_4716/g.7412  ORF Transcript_4716/g.7412 Transcript_4716/m.7412 type:complete len:208 (-) Transcript_4716:787-1410(-)
MRKGGGAAVALRGIAVEVAAVHIADARRTVASTHLVHEVTLGSQTSIAGHEISSVCKRLLVAVVALGVRGFTPDLQRLLPESRSGGKPFGTCKLYSQVYRLLPSQESCVRLSRDGFPECQRNVETRVAEYVCNTSQKQKIGVDENDVRLVALLVKLLQQKPFKRHSLWHERQMVFTFPRADGVVELGVVYREAQDLEGGMNTINEKL